MKKVTKPIYKEVKKLVKKLEEEQLSIGDDGKAIVVALGDRKQIDSMIMVGDSIVALSLVSFMERIIEENAVDVDVDFVS